MAVRSDIQRKWTKQHGILDRLYERFSLGDEIKGAVGQFIPEWGSWNDVYGAWKVFQEAEILLNMGNLKNPLYGVMKNAEDAHESLTAYHESGQKPEAGPSRNRGSSAPAEASILRHVSGPDVQESKFEVLRPLRKDESLAIVEAARQYLGRKQLKAQKLKELRDGGINVPDNAIPLARDERLENVLLTLPYIDTLLSADTKYGQLAEKYRELEATHLNMKRSYDSLRRWRDQQMANAIDGVTLPATVDRVLDRIDARAKTNGHAESGAANGGAEDPARPAANGTANGSAGDPAPSSGEPEVHPGEARPPQSRDAAAPATR